MSDQLLVVFRVCLLVLMYLVFLRVLKAVWVELKGGATVRSVIKPVPEAARTAARVPATIAPAAATPPAPAPATTPTLTANAPPTVAGTAFELDAETTIGRGDGCRISVDDTHVSKIHARVFSQDGRWFVEDLGSTNGTLVNEEVVSGAAPVGPGDHIRVGETVLELQ